MAEGNTELNVARCIEIPKLSQFDQNLEIQLFQHQHQRVVRN